MAGNRGKPSNRELLTRGDEVYAKKREKRKEGVPSVGYDPEARQEYLTGFHKRKVQRKENAQKKNEEMERLARIQERARIREERKAQLTKDQERFKAAMKDIAQFRNGKYEENDNDSSDDDNEDMAGQSELAINGDNNDEDESEYSDWEGLKSPSSILKKKTYYDDDDATVTVQEIDTHVDLTKSEQVLMESLKKAQESASYLEAQKLMQAKLQGSKKQGKKKFRYLSKADRKLRVQKEKQKKRRS